MPGRYAGSAGRRRGWSGEGRSDLRRRARGKLVASGAPTVLRHRHEEEHPLRLERVAALVSHLHQTLAQHHLTRHDLNSTYNMHRELRARFQAPPFPPNARPNRAAQNCVKVRAGLAFLFNLSQPTLGSRCLYRHRLRVAAHAMRQGEGAQ